jgi:pyruvate-ferredoxin/flavodoxin oxidoreductase
MIKVRLYRPFSAKHFLSALPKSVKKICVLDRTKEPGAAGEPLYQDVITVLAEAGRGDIKVIGGAMACRPRNSRRPWPKPCSTTSPAR